MKLATRFHPQHRLPHHHDADACLASVTGLRVAYGSVTVLEDVDLEVHAGEIVAVVGPNGAGKSTLLAAMCGDVSVAAGSVVIEGDPLEEWSTAELAMRRSVLPQATTLAFPFTVDQVVRMGRAPWAGTPLEELDDLAVADALAVTESAEFAPRRFHTLSGGERARVALARVLAQQTSLLLLDEPTAALDLRHQELVLEVARRRADEGAGVLVVLHDLGLAAAHADRVAVLEQGRIVATGPPADVFTPELLSRVYEHDVDVFPHPTTGVPVVLPARR